MKHAPVEILLSKRLVLAVCVGLGGCYAIQSQQMQSMRYSHPTASADQFGKDKYACMQETRHGYSASAIGGGGGGSVGPYGGGWNNSFGGSSVNTVRNDWGLYKACMQSRGYTEDPNGRLGG